MKKILFIALLFVTGCSTGTAYKVVPVEGKIAFSDGKMLPEGSKLLFRPAKGDMGSAEAIVNPNGSFKAVHAKGMSGVEVGKYTVLLKGPKGDASFYKKIPESSYNDGIPVEIKEGMQPLSLIIKRK